MDSLDTKQHPCYLESFLASSSSLINQSTAGSVPRGFSVQMALIQSHRIRNHMPSHQQHLSTLMTLTSFILDFKCYLEPMFMFSQKLNYTALAFSKSKILATSIQIYTLMERISGDGPSEQRNVMTGKPKYELWNRIFSQLQSFPFTQQTRF